MSEQDQEVDGWDRVVAGIHIVDRSIDHHDSELDRLWGLRASLAARLDTLGHQAPPVPRTPPTKPLRPWSHDDSSSWLERYVPQVATPEEFGQHRSPEPPRPVEAGSEPVQVWTPPEQHRVGERLLERMAAAGISAPAGSTREDVLADPEQPPARRVEAYSLHAAVAGARRYERVLLRTDELPLDEIRIFVYQGPIQEAHLFPSEGTTARCGFAGDREHTWWQARRENMADQVELCRPCAEQGIPGLAFINHQ